MKRLFKLSLIVAMTLSSAMVAFSQAKDKTTILTGFFKDKGIGVISSWAHPSTTCYTSKAVIRINGSMIDLTLSYTKESKKFSCTYTVIINPKGYFSRLTFVDGYPKNKCFGNCKGVENLQSFIKTYKSDTELLQAVEGVLQRSLKEFDCIDYCLLGLNYYWKLNGSRAKYLEQ
jgi:hypothetical protein